MSETGPLSPWLQMVFSPLIPASQAPNVVLHHNLPLATEIGPALVASWQSKLTLLSLALELLHYLDDPQWQLASSCRLSHFGYDSLTVSYGEHSVSPQLLINAHHNLTSPLLRCLYKVRALQVHILPPSPPSPSFSPPPHPPPSPPAVSAWRHTRLAAELLSGLSSCLPGRAPAALSPSNTLPAHTAQGTPEVPVATFVYMFSLSFSLPSPYLDLPPQGIMGTEETLSLLHRFMSSFHGASVRAVATTHPEHNVHSHFPPPPSACGCVSSSDSTAVLQPVSLTARSRSGVCHCAV